MKRILPPVPPMIAIRIVDGDTLIAVTEALELTDARQQLARIREVYPDSTLGEYADFEGWTSFDDERVDRMVYQHSMRAMQALTQQGLPLVHWDLAPYKPNGLGGSVHGRTEADTREVLAAFAEVLGAGDVVESTSEHGLHLSLSETVWGGVRVEMKAYVPKHRLASVQEESGECVECEGTGQNCGAHRGEQVKAVQG